MKRTYVSGIAGIIGLVLGMAILALAAPAVAARSPVSRTLAEGAGMGAKPDKDVRRLQRILRAQGRSLGPAGVDGRFGPATAAAVRGFQRSYGLPADGIAGPKTRKLLRIACAAGKCGNREHAAANRSPAGKTAVDRVSSDDGTSALRNGGLTAALVLAILLAALAYRRSRLSRDARAYPDPAPASSFPAAVIGYLGSVEYGLTAEQQEALEKAIQRECTRRGWLLVDILREVPGGGREALAYGLDVIDAGDATGMVVAETDSVAGSTAALGRVLARLRRAGACFVALDVDVDTTTREGAMAAAILIAMTEKERRRLDVERRALFGQFQATKGPEVN